jgi:copper(I)-binding protein
VRVRPRRLGVMCGAILSGVALVIPLEVTSGAAPSTSSNVAARVGHLEVIDPFLPDPASPSVAAIYLTVKNTGSKPDALISASSPVSPQSMLMKESAHGSTMGMLAELRIPAHGEASLKPGRDHLMLEQPKTTFKVGRTVPVTLRFARAGSVTLKVPVVPLSRIIDN